MVAPEAGRSEADRTDAVDPFGRVYDRTDFGYGTTASGPLDSFIAQCPLEDPTAIDLGAGAGRDTMALAMAGYRVTAVDQSDRGLERIEERARAAGRHAQVQTCALDVRAFDWSGIRPDAVVATTVLDHIPRADAEVLWQRIVESLSDRGWVYIEVHTTEDPGSPVSPGRENPNPVSETAGAVVNYFEPGTLLRWAVDPQAKLRVLHYEERMEWDYTHGGEHQHGKSVLLAVREDLSPEWLGANRNFPRRPQG